MAHSFLLSKISKIWHIKPVASCVSRKPWATDSRAISEQYRSWFPPRNEGRVQSMNEFRFDFSVPSKHPRLITISNGPLTRCRDVGGETDDVFLYIGHDMCPRSWFALDITSYLNYKRRFVPHRHTTDIRLLWDCDNPKYKHLSTFILKLFTHCAVRSSQIWSFEKRRFF